MTGKEQLREDWREQAVESEIIPFQEVPDCTRKRWDQQHTVIAGRRHIGSLRRTVFQIKFVQVPHYTECDQGLVSAFDLGSCGLFDLCLRQFGQPAAIA